MEKEKEWQPLSELCYAAGTRLGFILFHVRLINHGRSHFISILQIKNGIREMKWLSRLMGRVETETKAKIGKIKIHGSSTLTFWKSEDVNCLTMREGEIGKRPTPAVKEAVYLIHVNVNCDSTWQPSFILKKCSIIWTFNHLLNSNIRLSYFPYS